MSRLFPDHLRIALGATYAVLARVNAAKVMHWQMRTWEAIDTAAPWQTALTTISGWLTERQYQGMRAGITLSAELAPLRLLPWRSDAPKADQQALFAAEHFRRVYGSETAHWKIIARPTGYAQPWLASAVDEHLLQALPEQLQTVRISFLQPLFLSYFNALHSRFSAPSSWLVIPETSLLTLAHFRESQWALLKTLRANNINMGALDTDLLRETRLAGLADMPGTVYSTAQTARGIMPIDTGWHRGQGIAVECPLHLLGGRA